MELEKLIRLMDKDIRITVLNYQGKIAAGGLVSEYNGVHAHDTVTRISMADGVLEITVDN